MKKIVFFLFILTLIVFDVKAQENYFQQKVNYEIHVQLFPEQKKFSANETLVYYNNSPDTLTFLYFHLWPNGYSSHKTALSKQMVAAGKDDIYFKNKKVGGRIDSLDFTSNKTKLEWHYDKKNPDICKIILPKPLKPGDSIEISTPFRVFLPGDISRMGAVDNTFQISQWYPKPAVYDRYGWHAFPYLNQGEFYSEYGKFDVYITVPKQIVVAATGNLQNNKELEWLQKLADSGLTGKELPNPAPGKTKTLHYSENNIHDFAWFCSENYKVAIDSVFTPRTHHKVTTRAYYRPSHEIEWANAVKYINAAIKYYSQWVGDYPYNNCTAVDGALSAGGGMEYPTITVVSSEKGLETVIVHEVGHNWFYGMLGFNEREYPFLDEGINSFYDHRYSYEVKNKGPYFDVNQIPFLAQKNINNREAMMAMYLLSAPYFDQPLDLPSTDYTTTSYGLIPYEKTAEALNYLREYIGEAEFDTIMHGFFEQWKFKHPYPIDFKNYFENHTNKDVSWFFDYLVKTNGKIDYKISYRNNQLIIKNKGDFAAPITITGYKNGKIVDTMWLNPIEKKKKIKLSKQDYDKFIIDPEFVTLDYYRYNNYAKTHGIIRKYEKIRPTLTIPILDFYNAKTTILPMIYYSHWSKLELGGVITNYKLPIKKFSYYIMPVYSFGYGQMTGAMQFSYFKEKCCGFPSIKYSLYVDKYPYLSDNYNYIPTNFRKIKLGADFNLKNKDNSDKYYKTLKTYLYIFDKTTFFYKNYLPSWSKYANVISISFSMTKKSKFRPTDFNLNLDFIGDTYKFWAEFKYKIHYTSVKDGFEIRLFTGQNVPMVGTTGESDYKYEHYYFSRYEKYTHDTATFIPHQFVDEYGGITFYYPVKDYFFVNAVNLKSSIPKVPFVKLYYNFVSSADFVNGKGINVFSFNEPLFETGVMLDIIPDLFAVYLPLYGSKKLMDYNNSLNNNILSHFRFTFKLENFREALKHIK